MKVIEAKEQVLSLIRGDIERHELDVNLDPHPDDLRGEGKFYLNARPARVIHPYNGFHANINLDWFEGSSEPPEINYETFYWYVFALRGSNASKVATYHICDYHQMKEWVLDFDAPQGDDHRDHHDWRGEIHIEGQREGYFRWGDEPVDERRLGRSIRLRNIAQIAVGSRIGEEPAQDTGNLAEAAQRTEITTTRIIRDTALARRVKRLHDWECQLCGETVRLGEGDRYAEAHHIRPLGSPHDGPDVEENIVCVCPTCHVHLDYGTRLLQQENLANAEGHSVAEKYLNYHNTHIASATT